MGVNALIRENSQCHTFSTTTMLLLVHTASSYTQLVRTIYLKAPKAANPLKKKIQLLLVHTASPSRG